MCPNLFELGTSHNYPETVGVFEDDPLLLALARTCRTHGPGDGRSEAHPDVLDSDGEGPAGFEGWEL